MSHPDTLFNSSLSNVLKHWSGSEFIVVGWNGCDSKKLKKQIKCLGFAFVQVEGIGQEDEIITQPVFLVLNHTKRNDFLTAMRALARDHQQESLAHSLGDGTGAIIKLGDFNEGERSSIREAVTEFFAELEQPTRRGLDNGAVMLGTDLSSKLKGLRRTFPKSHIEGVSRQAMGEGLPQNTKTK